MPIPQPAPTTVRPRRGLRLPGNHGVWARLSALGERLGWSWLMYNPGIFRHFHQAGVRNAPLLADPVLREFPDARTFIDVGCGSGAFAAEFQRRGLKVVGFEHSPRGRRMAHRQGVDARPFDVGVSDTSDLSALGGHRADLVLSTEVGEHIPAALADAFVRFIASCGDHVVFTADQPKGDRPRGVGQVNEQPLAYWIAKFQALGYRHDTSRTARIAEALRASGASYYLHENLAVFEKMPAAR